MKIGFVIDNISGEPNLLHPTSAWAEIRIEPEDLLLPDEKFIERYAAPLLLHAKRKFFDVQESAAFSEL
jgi:hypothetical protein